MSDSIEFLALMAGLDDAERARLMARQLQAKGETSITESLRPLVAQAEALDTDTESDAWRGLPDGIVEAFTDGNLEHRNLVIGVWNTWVDVVNAAREAGVTTVPQTQTTSAARSGRATAAASSAGGGHVTADSSSRCPSCGVPSSGLCNRCENQQVLDDHIEYDRRLYEIDQNRIEHDRLRDDRTYYDTSPSYDTSYDTSYNDD
jgi:hypothetical protein